MAGSPTPRIRTACRILVSRIGSPRLAPSIRYDRDLRPFHRRDVSSERRERGSFVSLNLSRRPRIYFRDRSVRSVRVHPPLTDKRVSGDAVVSESGISNALSEAEDRAVYRRQVRTFVIPVAASVHEAPDR